jgi:hypothetical protein
VTGRWWTSQRWRRVGDAALVLVVGGGACALALPEARRPALVLAVLGAGLLVVTVASGWRIVGTAALACTTGAVLMTGALEPAAARPGRLLLGSVLLLVLTLALDRVEREPRWTRNQVPGRRRYVRVTPPPTVSVPLSDPRRRAAPVALAVAVTGVVAVASTADPPPSVLLVLVGLLAGVGAVIMAVRAH